MSHNYDKKFFVGWATKTCIIVKLGKVSFMNARATFEAIPFLHGLIAFSAMRNLLDKLPIMDVVHHARSCSLANMTAALTSGV